MRSFLLEQPNVRFEFSNVKEALIFFLNVVSCNVNEERLVVVLNVTSLRNTVLHFCLSKTGGQKLGSKLPKCIIKEVKKSFSFVSPDRT